MKKSRADFPPARENVADCPSLAGNPKPRPRQLNNSVQSQSHSMKECAAPPSDSTRGSKHCEPSPVTAVSIQESTGGKENCSPSYGLWPTKAGAVSFLLCPCMIESLSPLGSMNFAILACLIRGRLEDANEDGCRECFCNNGDCSFCKLAWGRMCGCCRIPTLQPVPLAVTGQPEEEGTVADVNEIDSGFSDDGDETDCKRVHPNVYVSWHVPGVKALTLMCTCLQKAYLQGADLFQLPLDFKTGTVDGELSIQYFSPTCDCSRAALAWEPQCEDCGAWFLKPIVPQPEEPASITNPSTLLIDISEGQCAQVNILDLVPEQEPQNPDQPVLEPSESLAEDPIVISAGKEVEVPSVAMRLPANHPSSDTEETGESQGKVSVPPPSFSESSNQSLVVMRLPADHYSEINKHTISADTEPAVGPCALQRSVRPTEVPSVPGLGSVPVSDDKGELTAPGVLGVSLQVTAEHDGSLSLVTWAKGSPLHRVLAEVSPLEGSCPVVRVDQYLPDRVPDGEEPIASQRSGEEPPYSPPAPDLSVSPCAPIQVVPGLGSNAPEFPASKWTAPEVPGTGPEIAEVGTDSVPEDLLATGNHRNGKVSTLYPLPGEIETLPKETGPNSRFPVEASPVCRDKDCVEKDLVTIFSLEPKKERSIHHVVDRGKGPGLLVYRIHAVDGRVKAWLKDTVLFLLPGGGSSEEPVTVTPECALQEIFLGEAHGRKSEVPPPDQLGAPHKWSQQTADAQLASGMVCELYCNLMSKVTSDRLYICPAFSLYNCVPGYVCHPSEVVGVSPGGECSLELPWLLETPLPLGSSVAGVERPDGCFQGWRLEQGAARLLLPAAGCRGRDRAVAKAAIASLRSRRPDKQGAAIEDTVAHAQGRVGAGTAPETGIARARAGKAEGRSRQPGKACASAVKVGKSPQTPSLPGKALSWDYISQEPLRAPCDPREPIGLRRPLGKEIHLAGLEHVRSVRGRNRQGKEVGYRSQGLPCTRPAPPWSEIAQLPSKVSVARGSPQDRDPATYISGSWGKEGYRELESGSCREVGCGERVQLLPHIGTYTPGRPQRPTSLVGKCLGRPKIGTLPFSIECCLVRVTAVSAVRSDRQAPCFAARWLQPPVSYSLLL
ncbi:uncharacterized protein LOC142466903 [Ascaphus truei]|uniref:uncharacterized protein LOC142466903 n=1 Tax=Ascaphus truei TaxID=8439 RepID=UPI003F5A870F